MSFDPKVVDEIAAELGIDPAFVERIGIPYKY